MTAIADLRALGEFPAVERALTMLDFIDRQDDHSQVESDCRSTLLPLRAALEELAADALMAHHMADGWHTQFRRVNDARHELLAEVERLKRPGNYAELKDALGRAEAAKADAEAERDEALAELDKLDSYNGHLTWMDKHYPLDVPYFAESEDVGCQVMRLSRKVMEQERMLVVVYETTVQWEENAPTYGGWLADLRARAKEGADDS